MDKENLTVILAQVLTSDDKWQQEVERNFLLQKTIDELFSDRLFHVLLENHMLPKKDDTSLPHFRAIELICTFREISNQLAEGAVDEAGLQRELEELYFRLSDKYNASGSLELDMSFSEAMMEVERYAGLYKAEPQFTTRLDRFRLLVVPLCSGGDEDSRRCQVVLLENIRSPRSAWHRK
ncbi:MAG: hypothetical protein FVQ81_03075 [Candidatus Glassbacteria bacterium]|nr:hypothetical protein [Candidatus Glassbacteria bacterium]